MSLYPQSRSALIPILHVAQEQDGWLTPDGMQHVAELLELTAAEVLGTASFYEMFFTHPVGRYLVTICTNLACMLNGGYELLEHAEERLGISAGATTPDGLFTVEEVECIALCGNAPCLAVNWRFFGDVTPERFDTLVDDLRAGRLADTVPAHGTLCRVRRTAGLTAAGPGTGEERVAPGKGEGAMEGVSALAVAERQRTGLPEPEPDTAKESGQAASSASEIESAGEGTGGKGAEGDIGSGGVDGGKAGTNGEGRAGAEGTASGGDDDSTGETG
jgi:NADH-quinone oxidoreductase E subunit